MPCSSKKLLTNIAKWHIITLRHLNNYSNIERSVYMNEAPACDFIHVHDDIVSSVLASMPGEEELYKLSELYKLFGDPTRIRILYVLLKSEMCVCDIAKLLNMTTSAISHQLKLLKQASLVKFRREGKTVFYSLADDHVTTIINNGMEHIEE